MALDSFFEELARLLEVQPTELTSDAKLEGFGNWDSLAKVSLIGFVHERYRLSLDGFALEEATTIGELTSLLAPPQQAET